MEYTRACLWAYRVSLWSKCVLQILMTLMVCRTQMHGNDAAQWSGSVTATISSKGRNGTSVARRMKRTRSDTNLKNRSCSRGDWNIMRAIYDHPRTSTSEYQLEARKFETLNACTDTATKVLTSERWNTKTRLLIEPRDFRCSRIFVNIQLS